MPESEVLERVKQLSAFDRLCHWMKERYAVYQRRENGQAKPWTLDSILQSFRFCNVYRELDRTTRWIAGNWRTPHDGDRDLWFALVVARWTNWIPTLQAIGYPIPWDRQRFIDVLTARQEAGQTAFGPVYTIRPPAGSESLPLSVAIAERTLDPLWRDRSYFAHVTEATLQDAARAFGEYQGMSPFMAGQVVADLKYCTRMRKAKDWWVWAAMGPGSQRGLNRLLGYGVNTPISDSEFREQIGALQAKLALVLRMVGMPRMHAQDTQCCLCEWDKHERVLWAEGRPKFRYEAWVGEPPEVPPVVAWRPELFGGPGRESELIGVYQTEAVS